MVNYRPIEAQDDAAIATIVRTNLKKHHLDIPGTVYFDPELDQLSSYYNAKPGRAYFIALDEEGKVIGGVGFAEFDGIDNCAELQKLYLVDSAKGKGYGKDLVMLVEAEAKKAGYHKLYLETHKNLEVAIKLYEKMGYGLVEKPCKTSHSTMDHFYLKEI